MRNAVKMVKLIAIFTVLANLFGCKMPEPHMLDGPGMEYVDSAYRTEYANTLPFDEIEEYPYCAAAYLGKGEEGKANCDVYIEKQFSSLPKEAVEKIEHFDCGGEEWYLIIPRWPVSNDILLKDTGEKFAENNGAPFVVVCSNNITIRSLAQGNRYEYTPQIDENNRLICKEDVWDITEYND